MTPEELVEAAHLRIAAKKELEMAQIRSNIKSQIQKDFTVEALRDLHFDDNGAMFHGIRIHSNLRFRCWWLGAPRTHNLYQLPEAIAKEGLPE